MWIILDLIAVAIVVIFCIISAKHGFVRTFIEALGFVAALLIAARLNAPLAVATYDKVIEPPVINAITQNTSDTLDQTVERFWDELPEFVCINAEGLGITKEGIRDAINAQNASDLSSAAKNVSQTVIKPVATSLIGSLYSLVIFLIVVFVCNLLAKVINKLFSFSIVGSVNTFLGGVVGLMKGAVISIIACTVLSLIVYLTANGFWIFTRENISQTYVFEFFAHLLI